MKVSCNHCGAQNDLGRMFCMACGKRMTITREDVTTARKEERSFSLLSVLQPLIVLALLALMLSAFWPRPPFESAWTEKEKALAGPRVAARVNGLLMAARAKRTVKGSFTADELTLYLKNRETGPAQPDTLSVHMEGSRLTVRQQAFAGPFVLGGKRIGPFRFSRDVTVEPKGRVFEPRGGGFGHLPLPGPLGKLVSGAVAQAFTLNTAEQTIEKQITQISVQDGKLEIVLGP